MRKMANHERKKKWFFALDGKKLCVTFTLTYLMEKIKQNQKDEKKKYTSFSIHLPHSILSHTHNIHFLVSSPQSIYLMIHKEEKKVTFIWHFIVTAYYYTVVD